MKILVFEIFQAQHSQNRKYYRGNVKRPSKIIFLIINSKNVHGLFSDPLPPDVGGKERRKIELKNGERGLNASFLVINSKQFLCRIPHPPAIGGGGGGYAVGAKEKVEKMHNKRGKRPYICIFFGFKLTPPPANRERKKISLKNG